jgi:hypothetical protein
MRFWLVSMPGVRPPCVKSSTHDGDGADGMPGILSTIGRMNMFCGSSIGSATGSSRGRDRWTRRSVAKVGPAASDVSSWRSNLKDTSISGRRGSDWVGG